MKITPQWEKKRKACFIVSLCFSWHTHMKTETEEAETGVEEVESGIETEDHK